MPKRKRIDIKMILAANPKVNAQQLAEVLKILEVLRKAGVQSKGYGLRLPFSKDVHAYPSPTEEDPRTVHLGR